MYLVEHRKCLSNGDSFERSRQDAAALGSRMGSVPPLRTMHLKNYRLLL